VWSIKVEMQAFATIARDIEIGPSTPVSAWTLALKALDELTAARPAPPSSPAPRAATPAAARGPNTPAATPNPRPANANAATAPTPGAETPPEAADGFLINGSVNNGAASPIAQSPAFGNNRRQGPSLYNGGIGLVYGDSALDARPFTFSGAPAAQPQYQNVRVTGNFGGPLKFSPTVTKDPTLFLSFQHSNDNNATTQPGVMPTIRERAGDFSESITAAGQPVRIVDPTTGLPFPGNMIPAGRLSPQAQALVAYYPLPDIASPAGYNFQSGVLSRNTQTLVTTRVTQVLSTSSQLVALLAYQRSSTSSRSLFGFADASKVSGVDTSATYSRRLTRAMTLRLRGQFTNLTNRATPFFANRVNVSGEAGITGNNQDPEYWGPPTLQFSTLTGLTDGQSSSTRTHTASTGVESIWTHGHHSVTFGGDGRWVTFDARSQLNPRGSFTFTGAATGSDLADFLLGIPATAAIASGNPDKMFHSHAADLYVSDDWRWLPTLTMQIGARWEYEAPPAERLNRLANLDIAPAWILSDCARVGGIDGRADRPRLSRHGRPPGPNGHPASARRRLAAHPPFVIHRPRRLRDLP
jgi:hypothetical protein